MANEYNKGYNEGLTTAVRFINNIVEDLHLFEGPNSDDVRILEEILDGLQDLFLDI